MTEAQARVSSAEFVEWMAEYTLDPWGESREDVRMGILASVIYNMQRGKGSKAREPRDFIPDYSTPRRPKTPAQQFAVLKLFTEAVGGTIH